MKKLIIITALSSFLTGCVSIKDVKEHATIKAEQGVISIVSVSRKDAYRIGDTIHRPKDPSKDSLLVVEAGFANLGDQTVIIQPFAATLKPVIGTYGIMPVGVDFTNPGEAAFEGMFKGNLAFTEIELDPDEAARRIFVFVYPRDKNPEELQLSIGPDSKNMAPWLSSPLKSEGEQE